MAVHAEIRTIADTYLNQVRDTGSDNIMALCPFHTRPDGSPEKHPSFAMSLTTGLYFCHACQAKGNLRKFLKNMGVSPILIDQVHRYALEETEGQQTPPPDPLRPKVISQSPIDDQLLGLFDYCPADLLTAGFTEETLKYFELGFDHWHNRTTYPIRDLRGQLVAISGRARYEDQYPRYKIYDSEYGVWNLPARHHWDKRTVLYNAFRVYPEVYFQPNPTPVVLVEGFKACMWAHQAGIKHVVALLGTYLSWEHKWILERMGSPVYLFFDNNDPGWRGAAKTADTLSQSLPVSIVTYPKRLADNAEAQPDSCTPQELLEQCQHPTAWHVFSSWL